MLHRQGAGYRRYVTGRRPGVREFCCPAAVCSKTSPHRKQSQARTQQGCPSSCLKSHEKREKHTLPTKLPASAVTFPGSHALALLLLLAEREEIGSLPGGDGDDRDQRPYF